MNQLYRAYLLAVFVMAVAVHATAQSNEKLEKRSQCQPTWVFISKQPLFVDSGPYRVKFSGILVGCAENLRTINDAEMKEAQTVLKKLVGEKTMGMIGILDSKELRLEAVSRINRSLGRDVTADIFFNTMSVIESM